jgi:pseudouridine-5'-phosphate glycosidase
MTDLLILPEVRDALSAGRPVVALESTLISHGLPAPENLRVALECENVLRRLHVLPATIAVLDGTIRVGLTLDELHRVATSSTFRKAGRRDLGLVVSQGLDAATTVSATLRIARMAGISIMATGGLGGVHRGAGATFDVSTDLDELARADGMMVVCSGVKSILDIPATLEALEARGVPVVGYRTGEFPAFTTVSSGLPLEWRVENPDEAGAMLAAHRRLKLPGAIVLAQPVDPSVALPSEILEQALADALARAAERGVQGKALTPFLLDHLRGATEGRSLLANSALIVANAGLAGRIAACGAA